MTSLVLFAWLAHIVAACWCHFVWPRALLHNELCAQWSQTGSLPGEAVGIVCDGPLLMVELCSHASSGGVDFPV